MKYYQVVATAVTLTGNFHLTDAQIAARKHVFGDKPPKDNRCGTDKPVQFKKGEVFGYAGDVPKGNTGMEPWQGSFDDRIKGERQAAAAVREKALAARNPHGKKDTKAGGLFGGAGARA